METKDGRLIWVLEDPRPGTGNQAIAVANALGEEYLVKHLEFSNLAKLPSFALGDSLAGITKKSKAQLSAPWPDLVISSGRRGASVAMYIKKQSGNRSFICHIMYPSTYLASGIDLIAVPYHDKILGENILRVAGAPHMVTKDRLLTEGNKWRPQLGTLSKPVIGLVVGGGSRGMPFGVTEANQLAQKVVQEKISLEGALIVTTSPRTGKTGKVLFDAFKNRSCEPEFWHCWDGEDNNPYLGILAHSDILIVTGDSISMLSESCMAPGSLYIFVPDSFRRQKHIEFHNQLYELGFAKPLGNCSSSWRPKSFNSSFEIADQIKLLTS